MLKWITFLISCNFLKFIFNWKTISLQYCVGFCHISLWISHSYTYIPSLLNIPSHLLLHPTSLGCHRAPGWALCHTANSHWLSILHMVIYMFCTISLHWSLRKAFLPLLANLWNSAFKWVYVSFSPLPFTSHLFTEISKASSDNHFGFLHLFFLGMVLIPASCTMSWTSINSSSGTISDLIPLNLFVTSAE